MRLYICLAMVFALLCSPFAPVCLAQSGPPGVGELLPRFTIPAPQSRDDAEYLGIAEKEPFWISEISAPLVIIEIFSMYCPYCQREAPRLNKLYYKIQSDPELKEQIKIIGIGAGNSPFEVNFFKKKFKVPFPMFPDPDFAIHKTLGEVRTPYFIVALNLPDRCPTVAYSKLGRIRNFDEFLKQITEKLNSEAGK